MAHLPGPGEATPAIADLDQNGYVDIAFGNGWIYWGGPEGYSAKRRQDLAIQNGHGAAVADLNRDGYLDLVITAGSAQQPESPSSSLIFWGSPRGFRRENQQVFRLSTRISLSPSIADLNKDGFLDLIFTDVDTENMDIFWGDARGFSARKHTLLQVQSSATVEIADLNGDGWLDLILGGGWDRKRFGRPTRQASIVWGSPDGFSPKKTSRLEAFDSLEQAVADLNKDGFLDIAMTNYHAYSTRTLPAFIYWGGPNGTYSESRRSSLPAESSSALTVADLNRDGWNDIVVFNHQERGDHGVGANIFWGGPQGYSLSRSHRIQTFGPHFGVRRDIGNIYDRKLREEYVSPPLELPKGKTASRLNWQARTPHGTAVKFQLRTGKSAAELRSATWQGPQGRQSYYERPGAVLQLPAESRWLQYGAVLTTPDSGSTPVLERVGIDVK